MANCQTHTNTTKTQLKIFLHPNFGRDEGIGDTISPPAHLVYIFTKIYSPGSRAGGLFGRPGSMAATLDPWSRRVNNEAIQDYTHFAVGSLGPRIWTPLSTAGCFQGSPEKQPFEANYSTKYKLLHTKNQCIFSIFSFGNLYLKVTGFTLSLGGCR